MRIDRYTASVAWTLLVFGLGSISTAQPGWPPVPPPPLTREVLCGLSLETLLGTGLHGEDTIEDRSAAQELVAELYQRELDRLRQQVLDELGPLAFAVFDVERPSEGELRLEELLGESCLHQALLRARGSANAEVRSRATALSERFHLPPALPPEVFGLPEAEPPMPKGPAGEIGQLPVRLNLPPPERAAPGAIITGTVVVEEPAARELPPAALGVVLSGLVVEVAGRPTRVSADGRFVFETPREWVEIPVVVRAPERPHLRPIQQVLVLSGVSGPPAADTDLPSGSQQTLWFRMPPVASPGQPHVVMGRSDCDCAGLTTRGFLGDREVPLLWHTPDAMGFDFGAAPPGPQVFSLFQGGELRAIGAVHNVRLTASSDKSHLRPGERATLTVRVEGLPEKLLADGEAAAKRAGRKGKEAAVAFLDYVNHTPAIGRFKGQPDRFSVPIPAADLDARAAAIDRAYRRRSPLTEDPELERLYALELRELLAPYEGRPAETPVPADRPPSPPPPVTPKIHSASDTRGYQGSAPGDFHVQVTLRLPAEAELPRPLTPRALKQGEAPPLAPESRPPTLPPSASPHTPPPTPAG